MAFASQQTVMLNGRVKYLHQRIFSVQVMNGNIPGDTYRCFSRYFCPVVVGDIFSGRVTISKGQQGLTANLVQEPLVLIPDDRDTVIMQMAAHKMTHLSQHRAAKIYDSLREVCATIMLKASVSDQEFGIWLDKMAQSYGEFAMLPKLANFDAKELERVLSWANKQRNTRRLWLFGLNNKEIRETHYDMLEIYRRCLLNPLTLTNISIEKCKAITARLGRIFTADQLEDAVIARKLVENTNRRAWTGTPCKFILKDFPRLPNRLPTLQSEYNIIIDMNTLYLPYQHRVEKEVAAFIAKRLSADLVPILPLVNDSKTTDGKDTPTTTAAITTTATTPITTIVDVKSSATQSILSIVPKDNRKAIKMSEIKLSSNITSDQSAAVLGSLGKSFSIIDGRAGTGKTTSIKEIVRILKIYQLEYRLCAFTGKAASRINKATGEPASTIHRLLARLSVDDADDIKVLVIDELSMVTLELFYNLIRRLPNVGIIGTGDNNQLPPIGWGSLMHQLMSVPAVPRFSLVQNHRMYKVNGEVDGILLNANEIIDHDPEAPELEFVDTPNFRVLNGDINLVIDMIKAFYKQGIPADHICVISPYLEYLPLINKEFQKIYNEGQQSVVDIKGIRWSLKDRVMALENDYNLKVLNGEEGSVIAVDQKEITIKFASGDHVFQLPKIDRAAIIERDAKGEIVVKKIDDPEDQVAEQKDGLTYDKLIHSFGLTVHKTQGSEWEFCIFFCPARKENSFLNKNLLYTAFTRAKRCLFVIANAETLRAAGQRNQAYRCDNLAVRLNILVPPTEEMMKAHSGITKITGTRVSNDIPDSAPYDGGDWEPE